MTPDIPPTPEPANLRFLRRLVTTLMIVMIGGFLILITLLVLRLQPLRAPLPLPTEIALPGGERAYSVTYGPDFFVVLTQAGEILLFDRKTFVLLHRIQINPERE